MHAFRNTKYTLEDVIVPFDVVLHLKTLKYWKLSNSWHGRSSSSATTIGAALGECNSILDSLNSNRPLSAKVLGMQENIVRFGTKNGMLKANKSVVPTVSAKILRINQQ